MPLLHRVGNHAILIRLDLLVKERFFFLFVPFKMGEFVLNQALLRLDCADSGVRMGAFLAAERYVQLTLSVMVDQVSVLEMDGQFDKLDELIYVESHLSNISTKFYGEITQQMLKHADFPGSNNGTGLFQTICGLKIRNVYERILAEGSTVLEGAKV